MTHGERFEIQRDGATAAADVGLADIAYAAGSSPDYVSKGITNV